MGVGGAASIGVTAISGHDRQMKSIILRFNCSFNLSVELWEIIFKTLMYTC